MPGDTSDSSISEMFNDLDIIFNTAGEGFLNYTEFLPNDCNFDANFTDLQGGLTLSSSIFEMGFLQEDNLSEYSNIGGYEIRKEAILEFLGYDLNAITDVKKFHFLEIGGKIYGASVSLEAEHHFPSIFGNDFGLRFTLDGTLGSLGLEAAIGTKLKWGVHFGVGVSGSVELLINEDE